MVQLGSEDPMKDYIDGSRRVCVPATALLFSTICKMFKKIIAIFGELIACRNSETRRKLSRQYVVYVLFFFLAGGSRLRSFRSSKMYSRGRLEPVTTKFIISTSAAMTGRCWCLIIVLKSQI